MWRRIKIRPGIIAAWLQPYAVEGVRYLRRWILIKQLISLFYVSAIFCVLHLLPLPLWTFCVRCLTFFVFCPFVVVGCWHRELIKHNEGNFEYFTFIYLQSYNVHCFLLILQIASPISSNATGHWQLSVGPSGVCSNPLSGSDCFVQQNFHSFPFLNTTACSVKMLMMQCSTLDDDNNNNSIMTGGLNGELNLASQQYNYFNALTTVSFKVHNKYEPLSMLMKYICISSTSFLSG